MDDEHPMVTTSVERWANETTGRPSRSWYWEVRTRGSGIVAAGICKKKSEAVARVAQESRLKSGIDRMIAAAKRDGLA